MSDDLAHHSPNTTKATILLVDDDEAALTALHGLLSDDYHTLVASSGQTAIDLVRDSDVIATVVMDIRMPGIDGITAARTIRQMAPDISVIFHTGYPGDFDEDEIDDNERPFDYVRKASPISRLTRSVRNAVDAYLSKRNVIELTRQAELTYGIIGKSAPMQDVLHLIRKASLSDSKVMILGETGTGKELVARAIHSQSSRRDQRLAIFNCNHKTPDLVESELFGHTKGAFTGAASDRIGLFEYANGGTVFLDEIGDLDITTQAKLLRVLEVGEYQRIGSPAASITDVRVVCATHRNLEQMVTKETFREDLYYRLKGIQITLPPLRDRRDDIPLLVQKFVDRFTIEQDLYPKIVDAAAMDALIGYDWPGNVRQLLDAIESMIITTDSDIILDADVYCHLGLSSAAADAAEKSMTLSERLKEFRKTLIMRALSETNNNISAAARLLGADRANLRKMIIEHGIELE